MPASFSSLVFQFHKGTIKTDVTDVTLYVDYYFNSIKVRLKHVDVKEKMAHWDISIP